MSAHPEPARSEEALSDFCAEFQSAMELIGRRWVGAIVRALTGGPKRFNELLGLIPGLSDRLLTERLRELERDGIVVRTVSTERPVRVTYALTPCGQALEPVLRTVSDWAHHWSAPR